MSRLMLYSIGFDPENNYNNSRLKRLRFITGEMLISNVLGGNGECEFTPKRVAAQLLPL